MGGEGFSTRRRFLAGGAGVGVLGALGSGVAEAAAPQGTGELVPFYGPHQAGIATPTQEYLQFAAFDVQTRSLEHLRTLLRTWSRAAALIAAGKPVGSFDVASRPSVDTGEALGLGPARATVTFGFGPGIFGSRRFGLAGKRPAPLVDLPKFNYDHLDPALCGGDLAVQVCADDPQVAFHAVHDLIRLARPVAAARWLLTGFGRTGNTRGGVTPRNLMGFKDGTANPDSQDTGALKRFIWASEPDSPSWMKGGSYMVVRRILIKLAEWDAATLEQQQDAVGRFKLSGAPLTGHHERDPINLTAQHRGTLVIPYNAHIRLASPSYNQGERILRRGYSFVDGLESSGTPSAGQFFICFQRDPRKQFIPIQRRLSDDALSAHTKTVGSAIFACPPGASHGEYVGQGLLG